MWKNISVRRENCFKIDMPRICIQQILWASNLPFQDTITYVYTFCLYISFHWNIYYRVHVIDIQIDHILFIGSNFGSFLVGLFPFFMFVDRALFTFTCFSSRQWSHQLLEKAINISCTHRATCSIVPIVTYQSSLKHGWLPNK